MSLDITARQTEWDALFGQPLLSVEYLRDAGSQGGVASLRSLHWRVFLGWLVSVEETDAWPVLLDAERGGYAQLKRKYVCSPPSEASDLGHNNPLSLDTDSPWQQFFADTELRKLIRQDVERTFPDQAWFKAPLVLDQLTNILFVWCKLNPAVSYRQGMHELLAPILFVVHLDATPSNMATTTTDPIINVNTNTNKIDMPVWQRVFDPVFVENDAFVLFDRVMRTAKDWFQTGSNADQTHQVHAGKVVKGMYETAKTRLEQKPIPILAMCLHVQNHLLKILDPELHGHLSHLNLEPQLYGLRWIRLLFGREFSFDQLLTLWDGIFADSLNMALVEWICVAMLITIRDELLASDYIQALQMLMKFPALDTLGSTIPDLLHRARILRARYESRGGSAGHLDAVSTVASPAVGSSARGSLDALHVAPAAPTSPVQPLPRRRQQQHYEEKRGREADAVLARKVERCMAVLAEVVRGGGVSASRRGEVEGVMDEMGGVRVELLSRHRGEGEGGGNAGIAVAAGMSSRVAAVTLHSTSLTRGSGREDAKQIVFSGTGAGPTMDSILSAVQDVDLSKIEEAASKTVKAAGQFFSGLFLEENNAFSGFFPSAAGASSVSAASPPMVRQQQAEPHPGIKTEENEEGEVLVHLK
ncbi:rab-GTPase-TBC domain-containing protein [Chytriomyces sp. MP71]|nr:rab-GTPase-TBC domain-containing protein [Chytriomyces sp. MP71]